MSYSNDITTKDQVLNEVLQNLINTRSLFNDLQSLRNLTHTLEDWSEPQKPEVLSIPFTLEDELNSNAKKSSKYSKRLVLTLISVGALTLIINYKPINGQNLLKSFTQSIPRPQFHKFNHIF